jgi:hypothetical protein
MNFSLKGNNLMYQYQVISVPPLWTSMDNQAITIAAIHDLYVVFLVHTITQLHALVTVIPVGPYMMQKEKSHAATNCTSPCLFADLPQLLIISDLIKNSACC